MIRPWYRSPLFWLGFPGLLFLIWMWTDSNRKFVLISFSQDSRMTALYHWRGGVSISRGDLPDKSLEGFFLFSDRCFHIHVPGGSFVRPSVPRWSFRRDDLPVEPYPITSLRPAYWHRSFPKGSSAWTAFCPDWVLIGCYLVAWTAALIVWQLRKARLFRASIHKAE